MNTKQNIELQHSITVDEYKAWLTGLLRGKGNALPDLNDWKAIKKMTDKIVPDVVEVPINQFNHKFQPYPVMPMPWHENFPTCGTAGQDGDNITIADGGSSISACGNGFSAAYAGFSAAYAPNLTNHYIEQATDADLNAITKIMGYNK